MPIFDHFGFLAPFYEKFIQPKEPEFLKVLLNLPTEGALLDAGGGTGRVAQFMLDKANQVIVADLSFKMLAEGVGKSGVEAICAPSEALPFRDGTFSRIIMVDALHHVIDQQETINELWRMLAPSGILVIEEPDIRAFGVKLIALGEKLLLMRSHFLSPKQIADLFISRDAQVTIKNDGPIAFVQVRKNI